MKGKGDDVCISLYVVCVRVSIIVNQTKKKKVRGGIIYFFTCASAALLS